MTAERAFSSATGVRAAGGAALACAVMLGAAACAAPLADPAPPRVAHDAMFRGGPEREGRYAPLAGRTLAGLQWRFMTEGDVVSTPVVAGSLVYVGSGDGRLYALDRAAGTLRWS